MAAPAPPQRGFGGGRNPLEELSGRVRAAEAGFRAWMARQPVHVEAPWVPPLPPNANPQAMASFKQAQALAAGPLVQARNFAVMSGTNAGISCVMRRIRGVEDIQGSMAAAFGSGALFSLVSGMGTPNPVASAITSGIGFAVFQGGFFMIGQKFSKPQGVSEANYYARTSSMLQNLGLEKYEKNFRKGLLTDHTLPLLTDSALKDVKIPPGPRLIILDQIKRDPGLAKAQ